ncbi:Hypothetical protein PHPALM_3584 [Phytophthora palmivora]|uniref:Peptidase A2 domain-containing protein n=1 Tax=Phytophthora palmivora TaxID=4796 RepID=A0A2P4YM13_9STRA|nr:Hypothetical protein PHPALM_3584 [Phytophthora palmivora]
MPDGGVLQFGPPLVRPHKSRWDVDRRRGEDVKLERSSGWNLVRAKRSKLCIYAHVEKNAGSKVSKRTNSTFKTSEIHGKQTLAIASLRKDEYARSDKYHAPGKWFKQAKAVGKLNNERVTLLFDSGAEVSIVYSTFARRVGCYINDRQRQECVGIGENAYMTEGRTKIKVTLAGTLVYYFDAWVGSLSGQDAVLGMDVMVPAGIRLDLADGTLCLPEELFSANSRRLELGQDIEIPVADSVEVPIYPRMSDQQKLWITRDERWVPTLVKGLGRRRYLRITNVSNQPLTLFNDTSIGIWLSGDHIPRQAGFVSIGSRRYNEWQNLAFETTTDRQEDVGVDAWTSGPMVERPQYDHPTRILTRQTNHPKVATMQTAEPMGEPKPEDRESLQVEAKKELHEAHQVCIHKGGDLFAEDVESQMVVLPEVVTTTEEVTIDNLQVGDPEVNTPEEIDRHRQIIWKRAHLLIGKGNALPPAPLGAICGIDVGEATPVAQRCRWVAPQFREKVSDLIKRLLSATIITHSTLSWVSSIVIIIKKNGVDIRLCIDYRLVNSPTKLMVYPIPLINDLLEDLDKMLWYCSLDTLHRGLRNLRSSPVRVTR